VRLVSIMVIFRRVAGVLAATVGVVFLIVGIVLLASQRWTPETGAVQSCRTEVSHSGTTSHSTVHQICMVQWEQDGQVHEDSLDLGAKPIAPGSTVKIRVNGGIATAESPAWVGYLMVGIAVVLFAGGGIAIFKRPRPRAVRGFGGLSGDGGGLGGAGAGPSDDGVIQRL
jgi:hypothetical protein